MVGEIDFGVLRTPDFFGNALRAQQLGQEAAVNTQRQNALRGYASDPQGSISQLATVDPEAAANLSRIRASEQATKTRADVAAKYGAGDADAARQAALAGGQTDLITALDGMDDRKKAAVAAQAEAEARLGFDLQKIPYGPQRKALLLQLAPSYGLKPDQVANIDPTDDYLHLTIGRAVSVKDKIERQDKLSKPVELDPSKNYYLPDEGQPSAPGQPSATPASAPSGDVDAIWRAVKAQESGGDGNAQGPQTPYGRAQGSTQMLMPTAEGMARKLGVPWRPDLMRGDTPRALAYQDQLGKAYFQEGLDRYGGDVSKALMYYHGGPNEAIWGPKTHQYVQDVTARIQPQGDAQPYEVASLGQTPPPPPNPDGPPVQEVAAAQPGQIPGYRMIQAAHPQWQADGKGNLVNPATGDRKKDPTYEAPPQPADPNVVKGLLEGRIMPPTQKAAATPYWQAQLEAAAAQDPNFDQINYQARAKTRADFTSGKNAQNIKALNTAIGHLDHLDSQIGGTASLGGFPFATDINGAINAFQRHAGEAGITNFEQTASALSTELTAVFRGTGGAEADVKRYLSELNSNASADQKRGAVRNIAELLNARLQAIGDQYREGMGTTKDPLTLLNPTAQGAFTRLMGSKAQGGQPETLPPQAAAALKPGHNTTFANGQTWTLRNGQPERVK